MAGHPSHRRDGAAHRRPARPIASGPAARGAGVFSDSEDFDPARTPNPHLAFGHGPRYCIGAGLARLELQEVFTRLPDRFPGLRLAVPSDRLRFHRDRLTGGIAELPVDLGPSAAPTVPPPGPCDPERLRLRGRD